MADPTLIIDAEPDWKETPEVAYSFATVVQSSSRFIEQRRPLLEVPTRTVSCKFVLESEKAQKLLNVLLSGAPQLCCTPIYSEPIFAGAVTQGALSITAETDLTYLWNAKNCDYLILLDYITGASEMLKVSSVTGQVIALVAAIVGVWAAAQTVIYPGIASAIKEVRKLDHSSKVASFGVQFEEMNTGEEATKAWVGFTDVVCPEDVVVASDCSELFNYADGVLNSALFTCPGWAGVLPTIEDNRLKLYTGVPSQVSDRYLMGTYQFLGAFDYYTEFEVVGGDYTYHSLYACPDGSMDVSIFMETPAYGVGRYEAYSDTEWGEVWLASPLTSGKLRLRRDASNNVYAYYWNSVLSRWEFNGSTDGIFLGVLSGPVTPAFDIRTDDMTAIYIDNFIVTEGCDNSEPFVYE